MISHKKVMQLKTAEAKFKLDHDPYDQQITAVVDYVITWTEDLVL